MSNQQLQKADSLKGLLETKFKGPIERIMRDRAPQFSAALVQIVNRSWQLQNCDPGTIVGAAITSAALDLSCEPAIGEAWLVPYGKTCSFQLGYRGAAALALRSDKYHRMGWKVVYEGELEEWDELTGELKIDKRGRKGDLVIGYAAWFKLLQGFERGNFWTKDDTLKHAVRYSKAYQAALAGKMKKEDAQWITNQDRMGLKSVLLQLLKIWGPKSIQFRQGIVLDNSVRRGPESEVEALDMEVLPNDGPDDSDDKPEKVVPNVQTSPQDAPPPSNTAPDPQKPAQSSPANAATPPNAPAGEKKPTIQDELAAIVTAPPAAYTFTEFVQWLEAEQDVADASSLPDFNAIHEQLAKRFIRSQKGMLQQLADRRLAAK